MHRYLIVAHRTLGSPELLHRVAELAAEGPSSFHLLVPVHHPADHHAAPDEAAARAAERLAAGLERLHSDGLDATGEVGESNPMRAVGLLTRRGEHFDGVLVCTLPPGLSQWLKVDVPNRLQRETSLPVEIIVARATSQAVG